MSADLNSDEKISLRSLDPDTDPQAEGRFVDAVMARIAGGNRVYPLPADPLIGVWWLVKPALIAASLTMVISAGVLARSRPQIHRGPVTVAEAVGIPPEFMSPNQRDNSGPTP